MSNKKTTTQLPPVEGGEALQNTIHNVLQTNAPEPPPGAYIQNQGGYSTGSGIVQLGSFMPAKPVFGAEPSYLLDWEKTKKQLSSPFHPDDLYFLPQSVKGGMAMAAVYANARVYTERMNDVIGAGFWQSEVVSVTIAPYTKKIKARLDYKNKNEDGSPKLLEPSSEISANTAGVVVRVGLYMGPVLGWVYQDSTGSEDTADDNWITTAEAQAYKRAFSKWGPGNYLYQFPKTEYPYDVKTGTWKQYPRIPEFAYPSVFCADCEVQITAVEYKDKENITQTMSAWDIYQRGINHFGVGVCPDCSKKRRAAVTNTNAESRLKAA